MVYYLRHTKEFRSAWELLRPMTDAERASTVPFQNWEPYVLVASSLMGRPMNNIYRKRIESRVKWFSEDKVKEFECITSEDIPLFIHKYPEICEKLLQLER